MQAKTENTENDDQGPRDEAFYYEIVVKGHLDARWAEWFEGMTHTHTDEGTTRLYGPVADRAALHARLSRIRDLGLELISVQQCTRKDANDHCRQ